MARGEALTDQVSCSPSGWAGRGQTVACFKRSRRSCRPLSPLIGFPSTLSLCHSLHGLTDLMSLKQDCSHKLFYLGWWSPLMKSCSLKGFQVSTFKWTMFFVSTRRTERSYGCVTSGEVPFSNVLFMPLMEYHIETQYLLSKEWQLAVKGVLVMTQPKLSFANIYCHAIWQVPTGMGTILNPK